MKRLPLVIACLLCVFCLGCGATEKGVTPKPAEADALKTLLDSQGEQDRKIAELENSRKGKEFRDLHLGFPLGKGKVRIMLPTDDEGNAITYPLSEVIGAYLTEADKIRAVATKMPEGVTEVSPTLVVPKPPCPPDELPPVPGN